MRRTPLAALILAGLVLAGCGAEADEAEKLGRASIVAGAKPLPENRVGSAQIERLPAGSASRAFLELWSGLQYQRWSAAGRVLDAPLVRAVGRARLVRALRRQTNVFLGQRPRLLGERTSRRRVIVRYGVRLPSHGVVPFRSSWHRVDGRWRLRRDNFIYRALVLDAEKTSQESIDATAKALDPRARRAGNRVRNLLNSYYARLSGER